MNEFISKILANSNSKEIKSKEEIRTWKEKAFSLSNFWHKEIWEIISIDEVLLGIDFKAACIVFTKTEFHCFYLSAFKWKHNSYKLEEFENVVFKKGNPIAFLMLHGEEIIKMGNNLWYYNEKKWLKVKNTIDLKPYLDWLEDIENRAKEEANKRKNLELEEARLKEEERLEKLKVKQSNILAELDKDGNGELDVVEVNNDFDTLVKKHQSKITEVDRSYILNFVKISNYQKTKRKNLQSIFNSIVKTKNQQELNNQVSLLKDQIHSYELILFHSLNMVTSLIEDDMFTFYEIYESFDKLEMFNSNHENEVSKRLINIEGGINDLMNSIRQMENNIIGELGYLSYVTQESYSELSHNVNKQLASIDSSIKTNSLLTGINAYQTYKLRQGK